MLFIYLLLENVKRQRGVVSQDFVMCWMQEHQADHTSTLAC